MLKLERAHLIIAIASLLIATFVLLAIAVVREERKITEAEVDAAIQRGLAFLNSIYDPEYLFDDPYIKEGPVFYRKLDMAIVLKFFLPEHLRESLRTEVVKDSEELISSTLESWRSAPLQGLPLSSDPPLDLYAVFAYYYPENTEFMLDQLLANLQPDGSWESYDAYPENWKWRKVTDESWPICALARHRVDWDVLKSTLDRKRLEGEMSLNENWLFEMPKTGDYYILLAIYHTFLWVEQEGYDLSEYENFFKEVEEWLARQPWDESLKHVTVYTADTLYWLCEGGCEDLEALASMAREVLSKHETDGGWRVIALKPGELTPGGTLVTEELYNTGRAHSTLMAILALESYRARVLTGSGAG